MNRYKILFVIALFLAKVARGVIGKWSTRLFHKLDEDDAGKVTSAIAKPVSVALSVLGVYLAVSVFTPPDTLTKVVGAGLQVLVIVLASYSAYRLIDLLEVFIGRLTAPRSGAGWSTPRIARRRCSR